jgi:hypothetical protein
MSDQPTMESPQSRLEAMLGDISNEPPRVDEDQPQEEQEELSAEPELEGEEVEEPEDEETEDDEPEAEADEEEDSDEEQTAEVIKLKVNGEEVEKPFDEVVALAQQGLDYTQKTQQVAEQRKEVEALQEQLNNATKTFQEQQQLNNLLIEDVAKITALDQQLADYQNVDWQKLSDSDFVEAQKIFFQYNQLQTQRNEAVSQFEAKRQDALKKQNDFVQEQIRKGKEQLSKKIPNWSQETTREIISTGKDYGYTDNELNGIVDPRHIEVLHDAAQWRKHLKSKNTVGKKKVASAKPVVRPGSKDQKQVATASAKKMREQLRKTGSSDVASKLIENLL